MKLFKGRTIGQSAALSIGLLFLFVGLVLTILGLIGDYGPNNNPFQSVNTGMASALKFGLTLTWLGVALLLVGALIFSLALNVITKSEERNEEKQSRRKQRLEAINSNVVDEIKDSTINKQN